MDQVLQNMKYIRDRLSMCEMLRFKDAYFCERLRAPDSCAHRCPALPTG